LLLLIFSVDLGTGTPKLPFFIYSGRILAGTGTDTLAPYFSEKYLLGCDCTNKRNTLLLLFCSVDTGYDIGTGTLKLPFFILPGCILTGTGTDTHATYFSEKYLLGYGSGSGQHTDKN
jgi:hypothetical protein